MTADDNKLTKPHYRELFRQEIFKDVDIETISSLLGQCSVRSVKQGQTLIRAGETNHTLYLILAGRFRVHLAGDLNNPVLTLKVGQSIGEISIIDHQPSSASVIADIPSQVLVISEDKFWEMVEHSHAVAYNTLFILAQRLRYGNTIINKIKDLLSEYEYHATVDPLTSMYNRRWLDNMLGRIMHRCTANRQSLSVLMIDIDHFKQFNDRHGHIAGDRALRSISATIIQNLRPEDLVTRYGGEELFALLPGLDMSAAESVAERLRTAVSNAEIRLQDNSLAPGLTASVGVAQLQDNMQPDQLIQAADEALYRAKHSGRNRVSR